MVIFLSMFLSLLFCFELNNELIDFFQFFKIPENSENLFLTLQRKNGIQKLINQWSDHNINQVTVAALSEWFACNFLNLHVQIINENILKSLMMINQRCSTEIFFCRFWENSKKKMIKKIKSSYLLKAETTLCLLWSRRLPLSRSVSLWLTDQQNQREGEWTEGERGGKKREEKERGGEQ